MRIAYLILAHRYPEQLVRLVRKLDTESAIFLIHLDKNTDDCIYRWPVRELSSSPNLHFLMRYLCSWAGFGIVQATIEGIAQTIERGISFDYFVLLSGQGYPIKTNKYISQFFQQH